jgi:hypothetical protein
MPAEWPLQVRSPECSRPRSHTAAYLAATGLVAWVVNRKLGLAVLRKAWFNFNLVWGAALVGTGLFTLLL